MPVELLTADELGPKIVHSPYADSLLSPPIPSDP